MDTLFHKQRYEFSLLLSINRWLRGKYSVTWQYYVRAESLRSKCFLFYNCTVYDRDVNKILPVALIIKFSTKRSQTMFHYITEMIRSHIDTKSVAVKK